MIHQDGNAVTARNRFDRENGRAVECGDSFRPAGFTRLLRIWRGRELNPFIELRKVTERPQRSGIGSNGTKYTAAVGQPGHTRSREIEMEDLGDRLRGCERRGLISGEENGRAIGSEGPMHVLSESLVRDSLTFTRHGIDTVESGTNRISGYIGDDRIIINPSRPPVRGSFLGGDDLRFSHGADFIPKAHRFTAEVGMQPAFERFRTHPGSVPQGRSVAEQRKAIVEIASAAEKVESPFAVFAGGRVDGVPVIDCATAFREKLEQMSSSVIVPVERPGVRRRLEHLRQTPRSL